MYALMLLASGPVLSQATIDRVHAQSAFSECLIEWSHKVYSQPDPASVLADAALNLCQDEVEAFRLRSLASIPSEQEAMEFFETRIAAYRADFIAHIVQFRAVGDGLSDYEARYRPSADDQALEHPGD